jgi:APA family basic amino acid/polyamine antiporter
VPPSVRIRGVDLPLFAVVGGLGTAAAWLVVVIQDAPTRYAGLAWLAFGFVFYVVYRRRAGLPTSQTTRAAVVLGPAGALEYRTILVPVVAGPQSHEAIDLAARLATERGATIVALRVIVVPMELPIDAALPEQEAYADQLLDEASIRASVYGVRTIDRLVRARRAGRAIVDEAERRQAEIVVLGAPRGRHRQLFGHTVVYVLKNAPCRVMVAAGRQAA